MNFSLTLLNFEFNHNLVILINNHGTLFFLSRQLGYALFIPVHLICCLLRNFWETIQIFPQCHQFVSSNLFNLMNQLTEFYFHHLVNF